MACYNRTKRADREQEIADLRAEVAAVDAGTWPRDINDSFRWLNAPTNPYLSARENQRIQADYAKRMCVSGIAYLEGIPARIAAGELPGWEA